ncbi:MAG TPA: type II toxin-antitoxin system VapC family toxin [Pontimonas sp.]|nr:type II toxin-antitoxin system VapC family toxin [Pontimonas sp.]
MRPAKGALLDTHVLIWALSGSNNLNSRVVRLLESPSPVFFSPVSIIEIVIKIAAGKMARIPGLVEVLETTGFRSLPLDTESAVEVTRFPELKNTDPFDRALLAQALTHSLFFETADHRLLALGIPEIRDAGA